MSDTLAKLYYDLQDDNAILRGALEKMANEITDYGECPSSVTRWRMKNCETCFVDDCWNAKKRMACWLQWSKEDNE